MLGMRILLRVSIRFMTSLSFHGCRGLKHPAQQSREFGRSSVGFTWKIPGSFRFITSKQGRYK